jgi:hypothetical protein
VSSCAHAIIADGIVPVARKLVPVSVILHFLVWVSERAVSSLH